MALGLAPVGCAQRRAFSPTLMLVGFFASLPLMAASAFEGETAAVSIEAQGTVPAFIDVAGFPLLEAAHKALEAKAQSDILGPPDPGAASQLAAPPREAIRTGALPAITSGDVRDRAEELSQRFTVGAPAGSNAAPDGSPDQATWENDAKEAAGALAKASLSEVPAALGKSEATPKSKLEKPQAGGNTGPKSAKTPAKDKQVKSKGSGAPEAPAQRSRQASVSSAPKEEPPSSSWLEPSWLQNQREPDPEPAMRPDVWRPKIMPTEPSTFGWDGLR